MVRDRAARLYRFSGYAASSCLVLGTSIGRAIPVVIRAPLSTPPQRLTDCAHCRSNLYSPGSFFIGASRRLLAALGQPHGRPEPPYARRSSSHSPGKPVEPGAYVPLERG